MTNNMYRRIACIVAMLALGAASSLSVRSPAAATVGAAVTARAAAPASARVATPATRQTGRGWGAMFGCAGCIVAGGLIIAGGPGSIFIAVNTPGSSIALLACVGSCYEVLAS